MVDVHEQPSLLVSVDGDGLLLGEIIGSATLPQHLRHVEHLAHHNCHLPLKILGIKLLVDPHQASEVCVQRGECAYWEYT